MSNTDFLKYYSNTYPSLRNLHIEDNKLILTSNTIYKISFSHVNLIEYLNSNLFILNEIELFQTLYVLELFYKPELNSNEITFITNYVNKYLELNDLLLANQTTDEKRINGLSIPIYQSYNDSFLNTPASNLIQNILNNHTMDINSGKNRGPKLVLKNPNAFTIETEENDLNYLEKAGFSVIILIVAAVTLTCLYLAFYMFGH